MIAHHVVAGHHLDALATDVDDGEAVALLWSSQYSKRALLLGGVMEAAAERHPIAYQSTGVEHAFAVLAAVSESSPQIAEQVLSHPQIGGWAAATMRRLRAATGETSRITSDLRHLGAIAASAAILADQDCKVSVPVHGGRVVLPLLGAVELGPGADDTAELHCSGGRTTVTSGTATRTLPPASALAEDAPDWRAVRRVSVAANGHRLDVLLDDLGLYRDYPGLTPVDRLSDETFDRWNTRLGAAWTLLAHHHPHLARGLSVGLSSIVPLRPSETRALSGTSSATIGAAAVSLPDEVPDLAVTLVHELQHSKLGALIDLLPLLEDSPDLHYAPWRDDPRPLVGLLHGCYAYLAVTQFWRTQRHVRSGPGADRAHFEFARWRAAAWRTTLVLDGSDSLTGPGRRLVAGMRDTLDRWRGDAVPPMPFRAARIAALDHWVMWRLRNLRVDTEWAGRLARAWLADRPCSDDEAPPVTIVSDAPPPLDSARLRLIHHLLGDQERSSPSASPADLVAEDEGAQPADGLLVLGDHSTAAECYGAHLRRDATDPTAWSGLAVAHALGDPDTSSRLLVRIPEVVRAVYGEIVATAGAAPDVEAVACWLTPLTDLRAAPPHLGPPPFDPELSGGNGP